MSTIARRGILALTLVLLVASIAGCGGPADTGGSDSAAEQDGSPAGEATDPGGSEGAETGVTGMPAGFPADVPVHPGTVTAYEPIQVTDTSLVHQLSVETRASFADVVTWYQTSLPPGWSVGYFEDIDSEGTEAKIALDGGAYAPAAPDGMGGGVLIGVFVNDDATLIVTTVNETASP